MLLAHLLGICSSLHAAGGVETKVALEWPWDSQLMATGSKMHSALGLLEEKGCAKNGKLERKMRMSDPHPEAISCDKSEECTTTG